MPFKAYAYQNSVPSGLFTHVGKDDQVTGGREDIEGGDGVLVGMGGEVGEGCGGDGSTSGVGVWTGD